MFLGANIDAAAEAECFGIRRERAVNYHGDQKGTAVNYKALSKAVSKVRQCADLSCMSDALMDWDEDISADYSSRFM